MQGRDLLFQRFDLGIALRSGVEAVSYTHLDVYKRQFLNRAVLERHGYDTATITDSDLQELAGRMGDYYCESKIGRAHV